MSQYKFTRACIHHVPTPKYAPAAPGAHTVLKRDYVNIMCYT